jgi:hypothetical protein
MSRISRPRAVYSLRRETPVLGPWLLVRRHRHATPGLTRNPEITSAPPGMPTATWPAAPS